MALLLESGDFLLLEDGFKLLLEDEGSGTAHERTVTSTATSTLT